VQICDVQPGYVQALSAFLPYGEEKIAAFGSSYRRLHSNVGTAEGRDL
jgi:hypothetical protein